MSDFHVGQTVRVKHSGEVKVVRYIDILGKHWLSELNDTEGENTLRYSEDAIEAVVPDVQFRVDVINPEGQKIIDFAMDALAEAEGFKASAERNDGYQYQIYRVETTRIA